MRTSLDRMTAAPRRKILWHRACIPLICGLLVGAGCTIGAFKYGYALFLLTPIFIGWGSAWIGSSRLGSCISAGLVANAILCTAFLILGIEGMICLIMAAPLIAVMSALGGLCGWVCRRWWENPPTAVQLGLLAALPLLLAWEKPAPNLAEPYAVVTEVIVAASPEKIWAETIAFSPITTPPTGILRLGIAYPTYAEIHRDGPQPIRICHFNTGPFVEPITAWEPPHRLAFSVASQPPSMRELGPWDIHPPHLDSMILSQHGEFLIEPLGSGLTRLRGTTWYTIAAAPAPYWRWWTDAIIHRIHKRVLDHISSRAQATTSPAVP